MTDINDAGWAATTAWAALNDCLLGQTEPLPEELRDGHEHALRVFETEMLAHNRDALRAEG